MPHAKRLVCIVGREPATGGNRRSPTSQRNLTLTIIYCSLAILILGCSAGNPVQMRVMPAPPDPAEGGPYRIGCDDVIDVLVWKQPQLTARVRVASDGSITLPLISQVSAAGRTTQQLQANLTVSFSKFVHDPRVTVRVFDPASRVFYALGEVSKP